MGNSNGDLARYWKLIYAEEQIAGGFVWEWADHAIKSKKGFLYGGDFGEKEHDGNFCVDGLVTADRKLKPGALEMRAVYGGKVTSDMKDIALPKIETHVKNIKIKVDEDTGELISVQAGGREVLCAPMHLNITRYIDNDRGHQHLYAKYKLKDCKPWIFQKECLPNGYRFHGALVANCRRPAVFFEVAYLVTDNALTVELGYEFADYVKKPSRCGLEFAIEKTYSKFAYVGYGPYESYIDKHIACEYGYYENTAQGNYTPYVRPQETGSHYASKYLSIKELLTVTAENPFSFSVLPYTTVQLRDTVHAFDLPNNDYVNVCIDVAMRGIGSFSCGPDILPEEEIPRKAKNRFIFTF